MRLKAVSTAAVGSKASSMPKEEVGSEASASASSAMSTAMRKQGICNASSGRRRRRFELGLEDDITLLLRLRIVCESTDKES